MSGNSLVYDLKTNEWSHLLRLEGASQVAGVVKNLPASAGDMRNTGSTLGLG